MTESPTPETPIAAAESARRSQPITVVLCALVVVAAWVVLQLTGLGSAPFHTKGEPREGLVVWEMTHGGGWILPRTNGVEMPFKPPLFHWLGALTSLARGRTDEWSIRFPSAALSLLGLLAVYAAGSALWSPRAGLCGALALMTTFEWARSATNARVDMTLTFGLELAFLSLFFFLRSRATAWLVPLYLGIAFAVLGKGPVGILLPGLVALTVMAVRRDISPLRQMRLGSGALAVGVLAGTWYVLALMTGGVEFFRTQIISENIWRVLDDPEFTGGHRHNLLYLPRELMLGVLPWTLFVPGIVARLWRERRTLSAQDARTYLLIWMVLVFTLYSISVTKRGVYLLGLYPALGLLIGWWWDQQCDAPDTDRWLRPLVSGFCWMLLGVLGLGSIVVLAEGLGAPLIATTLRWLPPEAHADAMVVSQLIRARWLAILMSVTVAAAALVASIRATRSGRWQLLFATIFLATATILLTAQLIVMTEFAQRKTLRGFLTVARQVAGPTGMPYFYKCFDHGAVYYSQGHIPTYDGPFPDAKAPRYLLMTGAVWNEAQASARNLYEQVPIAGEEDRQDPTRLVLVRRVEVP